MARTVSPVVIPEEWFENSWEDKARENPLLGVMGTPDFMDSKSNRFTDKELSIIFDKGGRVYRKHIAPLLGKLETNSRNPLIVDYGCGVGRVIHAALEDGQRIAGTDISPTMIKHAQTLVPKAHKLDVIKDGKSGLRGGSADLVFSFAVLKHIAGLDAYWAAVDDMCRLVKKGGLLALNANSQDFTHGKLNAPCRTENLADHSEHYMTGDKKPYRKRKYTTWSGIYISWHALKARLEDNGLSVENLYFHSEAKRSGIWVIARKAG